MMVKHMLILTMIVLVMFGITSCKKEQPQQSTFPVRLISLAPSITETLFALGLGDRVIGVTGYCTYPPEAKTREKIGGYSDANLEKIITMQPDLVVLSQEHEKQQRYLERFNIPILVVTNGTCAEVCSTFAIIGRRCGAVPAADSLIRVFSKRLWGSPFDSSLLRPKILFCVGRDAPGMGRIAGVFAAGKTTFYNDLIEAAGGLNAVESSRQAYARLSIEGLHAIAPDIIIDIAPAMDHCTCDKLVRDWYTINRLPAVTTELVYCFSNDYCTLPGPRLPLLLDNIKRAVDDFHRGKSTGL